MQMLKILGATFRKGCSYLCFFFFSFIFIQKSKSLYCMVTYTYSPTSTHANSCTYIHNVTLFILTMKTVVEEPISCQMEALEDSNWIAHLFQTYIASFCITPSFQTEPMQINCVQEGACIAIVLLCVACCCLSLADLCYINKNEQCLNNAKTDLTLRITPHAQLVCHLPPSSRR